MDAIDLILGAGLLACSAYLSSTEVALFSLSRFQLRSLKEQFSKTHRKVKRLLGDPSGVLITILVLNEIVNISFSALVASHVSRSTELETWRLPGIPPWMMHTFFGVIIATPLLLIVGEITPKVIAARGNRIVALLNTSLMGVLYDVLKPIRFALTSLIHAFRVRSGAAKDSVLKESDFMMMVEEGHREGAIEASELELIKNVFELDDTSIADLYTPMSEVTTLSATLSVRDAISAFRTFRYSRIPVMGAQRGQVIGILYTKDLLHSRLEKDVSTEPIANFVRKPLIVSPEMRLNSLFRKFKQQRLHMAIVKREDGPVLGVITMSDVLNALFEDLFPENAEP